MVSHVHVLTVTEQDRLEQKRETLWTPTEEKSMKVMIIEK